MRSLAAALLLALTAEAQATAALAPPDPVPAAAQLLQAQLGAHRLILLGETHGTRETPQLVAALAARQAQDGPVLVVLELSRSVEAGMQRYLDSDGSPAARETLLAEAYWHKPREQSDGRRNLEVVDLLEALRRMRAQGKSVSVLAMDLAVGDAAAGSEARDRAMAARIREAFAKLPAAGRMLVVCGNVHAMKAKPMFAPPEMQTPMGSYLLDLDPYSVIVMAGEGEYWACYSTVCGPQVQRRQPVRSGEDSSGAYDFRLALPRYTLARLIHE